MTVDHEYLTNKHPTFVPKEQYDFMRSKKPIMMSESSMISNYLNL